MAAAKRKSASKPTSRSVVGATRELTASTILPSSPEVRFLDGLVTIVISAVTVLWTATRTGSTSLTWAVFWMLLGTLMAVEGRGELRYGGFGVAAANSAYLALRIAQLVKTEPTVAYAQARQIQAAYRVGDVSTMRYVGGLVLSRVS